MMKKLNKMKADNRNLIRNNTFKLSIKGKHSHKEIVKKELQ